MTRPANYQKPSGFTLIELIIVILLIGILAGVLATILRGPVQASFDIQRRASLVDIAETALQRMTREIRLALPNSVRLLGGDQGVEFLRTVDGGRYRADPPPGNRRLRFIDTGAGLNGTFEVLGGFLNAANITANGAAGSQNDCLAGLTDCLVVYNTGQAGANAYNGDNVGAIQAVSATELTFVRTGSGFPLESPQQRFQIVDTPVSFICDGADIFRYDSYTIGAVPTTGNENLLIDKVTACSFSYEPGAATRAGLVTISLTVTDGSQSVTIMQQSHVDNQP
ncbi:MAG: prepilin-type N-terminal cleavage/methylation domain-containing protein [Gammaproteobacteria bacterium]